MNGWEFGFWFCAGVVAYTCVGYPMMLAALSKLRARPVRRDPACQFSVSIVIAAHNEEDTIRERVEELQELLRSSQVEGEIIVVSDGSTDTTVERLQSLCDGNLYVLELPQNGGKAAALNAGCAAAQHDILVFADARQRWHKCALRRMLENFADDEVGAVSGELVLESERGVMAGVGLYWRMEKWIRRQESRLYSLVQVTGAICAVRRHLYHPIPAGTMVDDMYWPLAVVKQGYRVVHDERALAFDLLPDNTRGEFRRKVRTLCGNFQLLLRIPNLLLPWTNPVWWQWISHKFLRLVVPWAMIAMLVCCAMLTGPVYRTMLALQGLAYLAAVFGWWSPFGKTPRLLGAISSFLVLNVAAWCAFWVWISGRADRSWKKATYSRLRVGGSSVRLPASGFHQGISQ